MFGPDSKVVNLRSKPASLAQPSLSTTKIGATPKGGNARLALTALDGQGRDLVTGWMRDAGLTVTVDRVGNIFVAHFFILMQQDRHPLPLVQLFHRLLHDGLQFPPIQLSIRHQSRFFRGELFGRSNAQRSRFGPRQIHFFAAPFGPARIAGQIVRNPEQPRRKPRGRLVTVAGSIDPQEHILSQIFGRFLTLQHVIEDVCQSVLIRLDQLRKRTLITLLGPKHQLHFGIMQVT